jgi:hypothetical protein
MPHQVEAEYLCDLALFGTCLLSNDVVNQAQDEANAIMTNQIINPPAMLCGTPTTFDGTCTRQSFADVEHGTPLLLPVVPLPPPIADHLPPGTIVCTPNVPGQPHPPVCTATPPGPTCKPTRAACTSGSQCCSDVCDTNTNTCCIAEGASCTSDSQCCEADCDLSLNICQNPIIK